MVEGGGSSRCRSPPALACRVVASKGLPAGSAHCAAAYAVHDAVGTPAVVNSPYSANCDCRIVYAAIPRTSVQLRAMPTASRNHVARVASETTDVDQPSSVIQIGLPVWP